MQSELSSSHQSFVDALLVDARVAAAYRGERSEFRSRLDGVLQALRLMLETDAFLALTAYRAKEHFRASGVPVLPWIAHRIAIMSGQVSIADTALVHPGVFIPNGQVVVYGAVEIEPLVTLSPWVTVGSIGGQPAGPTIRAGAQIGTGAKVMGEVEVGALARVGTNAVVLDDVAPGTTVVGMPAKGIAEGMTPPVEPADAPAVERSTVSPPAAPPVPVEPPAAPQIEETPTETAIDLDVPVPVADSAEEAETTVRPTRSSPLRRIDLAIVALAILGIGVASYRLDGKSLWLDEAVSAHYARLDLAGLWKVVSGADPNGGLYYVVLRLWTRLFGYGEIALRSLTVLLGGLAVAAMVLLGRRLFGRAAGLAAGLLLAISPFFVHYEQTVRTYALVVLLVVLSSYFFVRDLEQPSRATRVGFVLASALAVYAHYFAAYVLLVQALTLLAVKRRAALSREWLVPAAAIAILCAPEVVFALRKGNTPKWIRPPHLHDLIKLPSELAGGRALLIALVLLAGYGLLRAIADDRRWRAGFVAAWLVLPVALDFAVSKLGHPLFVSYYLIVVVPALLLLAAAGLVSLPGRVVPAIVLVLLVAGSGVGLADWYKKPSQEDYRGATRYVLEHRRAGDEVIYYPGYISMGVEYYERLAGHAIPAKVARPSRIWLVLRSNVTPGQERQMEQLILPRYAPAAINGAPSNPIVSLYRLRSGGPAVRPKSNVVGPQGVIPSAVAACLKAAGARVIAVKPAGPGTAVYAVTPDGIVTGVVKAPGVAVARRIQQAFSAGGFQTQPLANDPAAFGMFKGGTPTSADSTLLSECS